MSEDQHKRYSGDFVATAVSDGTWNVSIGDNPEAFVGTVRPSGDGWEAIRHRPIKDFAGGVYNWLPPIVLGSAPTIEEAARLFETPVDPMQLAYLQEADTGQPLCPLDGSNLGADLSPERDALVFLCKQCDYSARLPITGGALPE